MIIAHVPPPRAGGGPAADAHRGHGPQRLRGPHRHRAGRARHAARAQAGGAAQARRHARCAPRSSSSSCSRTWAAREVDEVHLRRHLRRGGPGRRGHRRHHRRRELPRAAADHRGRRADPVHDLPRQRQPRLRPGQQVQHQPPGARTPAPGGRTRRGAAVEDGAGRLQGLRSRRAAPVDPDGEHAPRGLRVHGGPAAGHLQGDRRARRPSRSRS